MLDTTVARAVLCRAQLLALPDALMQQEAILRRVISLQPELPELPEPPELPELPEPPPASLPAKDELLEIVALCSPVSR